MWSPGRRAFDKLVALFPVPRDADGQWPIDTYRAQRSYPTLDRYAALVAWWEELDQKESCRSTNPTRCPPISVPTV